MSEEEEEQIRECGRPDFALERLRNQPMYTPTPSPSSVCLISPQLYFSPPPPPSIFISPTPQLHFSPPHIDNMGWFRMGETEENLIFSSMGSMLLPAITKIVRDVLEAVKERMLLRLQSNPSTQHARCSPRLTASTDIEEIRQCHSSKPLIVSFYTFIKSCYQFNGSNIKSKGYLHFAANIKLRITLTSHLLSTMSFRTPTYWKSMLNRLGGRSSFATSTSPKMKAYAPASEYSGEFEETAKAVRGEFIPVCVAVGMIAMSASLGLTTALHQLMYAPNVRVKKSRRETVPEVVEPELVVDESDKYIKKSLFRKVAHIQEVDVIPEHAHREILTRPPHAETLKEVGVDPKIN